MVKLQPLEFIDCLIDSPDFRENLNKHEKELEKTSQQIKRIIKEIKDLLAAAKSLSRAQRTLSKSLKDFNFEFIGSTQTDDEQVIADSLKQFSKLISAIEEERDNMLDRALDQIVLPLEEFRKLHIGGVKENKKKYDKKTAKFCQAQERFLNMSSKKSSPAVVEADASLGMLEREYLRESLSYVLGIQEVQERIKFEFVEIILRFISDWLVFYHLGHEVAEDAKEYLSDLQLKVQKTRENFDETRQKAQELKNKYMDSKMKLDSAYTKQGYLYLMEKIFFYNLLKEFAVVTWSKYYCTYKKESREFSMLQYNQMSGRSQQITPETFTLVSCTRRLSEFEKRYCFDLIFNERTAVMYTFQALSEEDIKAWLDAMDGKEPTNLTLSTKFSEDSTLDDAGFSFVKKCIEVLENRGLEEEGLYRIGGVSTKIAKLLQMGLDRKKPEKERFNFFYDDLSTNYADILESKTIASALKQYLRHLNEPLMTFRLHHAFIAAAKQDARLKRIHEVHQLVHKLPANHFDMLDIVIRHLRAVSLKCDQNKMSVFNLGVVFGPTILRAAQETVAAILDIKFNNVVVEILIENYDNIFNSIPAVEQIPYAADYFSSPSYHHFNSVKKGIICMTAMEQSLSSGGAHSYCTERTPSTLPIHAQPQSPVRVVAKSNYIESHMSPTLLNVSNDSKPLYSKGTNHYPTYEAKPTIISSSIPTTSTVVVREQQDGVNPRIPTCNTISTPSHQLGIIHHQTKDVITMDNPSIIKHDDYGVKNKYHHILGTSMATGRNQMSSSQDQAGYYKKYNSIEGTSPITDDTGYDVYNQVTKLTTNDSNLSSSRKDLSIYERINSTSSSNESVCSSSGGAPVQISHGRWPGKDINKFVKINNNRLRNNSTDTIGAPKNKSSSELFTNRAVEEQVDKVASTSSHKPKKTQRSTTWNDKIRNYNITHVQQFSHPTQSYTHQQDINSARENLKVRTLYACLAENDGELSFEPNQIITNVRRSNEPGWLEGTLNGKSGLIPENYVEILQ